MILILAGVLLLACGGLGVVAMVAIRVDQRRLSLADDDSRACEPTAIRRLLGVYVRQAGKTADVCGQAGR
jgi:hypothetical protein